MVRILAALAVIVFLFFFANWQKDNPPESITTPNAQSEKVKESLVGSSLRARSTAKVKIGGIEAEQQRRLDELQMIE